MEKHEVQKMFARLLIKKMIKSSITDTLDTIMNSERTQAGIDTIFATAREHNMSPEEHLEKEGVALIAAVAIDIVAQVEDMYIDTAKEMENGER